jgi:hypothetical protein
MNFKLIKKDDETFELTVLTNMSDMPYLIERSDDYEYLYKKNGNMKTILKCLIILKSIQFPLSKNTHMRL